jgi:hypothetical protein
MRWFRKERDLLRVWYDLPMMHLSLALYVTVLGWMGSLGKVNEELAWAIASLSSSPSEAALVTAIAFRESSFDNSAVGDSGRSFCAMQIHSSSGGSQDLLENPEHCVSRGLAILRQSVRVDRAHPVAFYARGPRWQSDTAQRLSNDRVALAKRLLSMYL